MDRFKAIVVEKTADGERAAWQDLELSQLMDGDVDIRVTHTTINYKDGLAITGKAPIVRRHPMIPGIDMAGRVIASSNSNFKPGDEVLLNGCGLGETHMGGYSQMARVRAEWVTPLPKAFSLAQSMALGTAGYTAMLCVLALEHNGVTPGCGKVLVTGAAGGVGSIAILALAKLGYDVTASTGRLEEADYLKLLGAAQIMDRAELSGKPRPLGRETWAGAIDVAGSTTLANVISQISHGGCVAACGLAQGMDLPTNVAPFILRGVTLAGINSVIVPKEKRIAAWDRLARDIDLGKLAEVTQSRPLGDVFDLAPEILAGKIRGRIVLDVG